MPSSVFGGVARLSNGQVALPGVGEVGLLVTPAFLFVSSLTAAVDIEMLAEHAGEGVGGHGLAFVPFVPLAMIEAVQVVEQFIGEDALGVVAAGEGVIDVGEQLHG